MIKTTSTHAVHLPSATETLDYPALASLAVLDTALRVAATALAVHNPNLQFHQDHRWPPRPPTAAQVMASVMIEKIEALGATLQRYRFLLAAEDDHSLRDYPF